MPTVCRFCTREIKPGEPVRWGITGWEKDRTQGGTNAIELRRRTGQVAHALCVDRQKQVHGSQLDMLDALEL